VQPYWTKPGRLSAVKYTPGQVGPRRDDRRRTVSRNKTVMLSAFRFRAIRLVGLGIGTRAINDTPETNSAVTTNDDKYAKMNSRRSCRSSSSGCLNRKNRIYIKIPV